jgi:hypothetical protein
VIVGYEPQATDTHCICVGLWHLCHQVAHDMVGYTNTRKKNENKFFKLAAPKTVSTETKEKVAKLILIIQKRLNLVKEFTG